MKSVFYSLIILLLSSAFLPGAMAQTSGDCITLLEATSSHDEVVCENTMVQACARFTVTPPEGECCDVTLTVIRWIWALGPEVPVDTQSVTLSVCNTDTQFVCLNFIVDCLPPSSPFANIPSWFSFELTSDCCEGDTAFTNYVPVDVRQCNCPEPCCDYNLVSDDNLATIDGNPLCSGPASETICPGSHTVCYTVANNSECQASNIELRIDAEIILPGTPGVITLPGVPQVVTIPPGGSITICQDFTVPDPGVQANIRFPLTFNDPFCNQSWLLSRCGIKLLPCSHVECAGNPHCDGRSTIGNPVISNILSSGLEASVYPNPFQKELTIEYILQQDRQVTIYIYHANGQLMDRLSAGKQSKGIHQVHWQVKEGFPTGLYFFQIDNGSTTTLVKALLK